jgi:predicted ribosome quality control (RQC) complex YloA/Tae2 family protein
MRRRTPKAGTPLNDKQEELARRESKLRDEMQKLERMIAEAPRVAEEKNRREREEIITRAHSGEERLNATMALHDKRYGDSGGYTGRRVSLRKERREGRIVFLVLVIALAAAVVWLMSHLPF